MGREFVGMPVLRSIATHFYCAFAPGPSDPPGTRYVVRYSPGADRLVSIAPPSSWHETLIHVRQWIQRLRHELDGKDPWDFLTRARALLTAVPYDLPRSNDGFSDDELRRLDDSLDEIVGAVKLRNVLATAQVELLAKLLGESKAAARRLGRVDWKNAFVGAAIALVMNAALPAPAAEAVLQAAGDALRWLVWGIRILK